VDSQNRVFFIAVNGSTVLGGFGTVTMTSPALAKTIKPNGDDHPFGDDHGQDADDLADPNEDLNDDHPNSTFPLALLTGEAVTGTLTFGHGAQLGDSILDGTADGKGCGVTSASGREHAQEMVHHSQIPVSTLSDNSIA
jgi:hypothetical protein